VSACHMSFSCCGGGWRRLRILWSCWQWLRQQLRQVSLWAVAEAAAEAGKPVGSIQVKLH
jgi:hypothetical protein